MENKFILGDCLEIIKNLPEKSIDCVITDPPYMITDLKFDKEGINTKTLCEQLLKILKDDGYFISFGGIELLENFANYFPIRWTGGWIKPNGTIRTATAKKPMSQLELYSVMVHPKHKIKNLIFNKLKTEEGLPYRKKQKNRGYKREGKDSISRANTQGWTIDNYIIENNGGRCQTDIIKAPNKPCMKKKERTEHPTQKPIKLITTLLKWCTNEDQVILDPFAGSGTTALACLENNRNYICIEKNEKYYKEAIDRIQKNL